ncbi:MAG: hypothetical protein GXP23_05505 [Gammaproteobacteria bacterium]|nr:hypothetical protein [Gammaproteobacteria bacterium]
MIGSNKQIAALLFVVAIGFGALIVLRFIPAQNDEQSVILGEQLEKVSATLAGFEEEFKTLNVEIRQLRIAVNTYARIDDHGKPIPTLNQISAVNVKGMASREDDDSRSHHNMAPATINAPTDQEMASVTLIVDKLRARDMYAYPDFPSLMTSPEMADLSSVAKDKIMAELGRMLESGEIDPSFFPKQ